MVNYPGIYRGANYGFDSSYKEDPFGAPIGDRYSLKAGQFGITTDPRTANQLKEVSDKLSTGAKTIEVSGISTEVLESVPDQHLREIARLKKLAGADITFHGPLVEPTGFTQQGRWEEANREQAERQIWDAVKRGQQMMVKEEKNGKKVYDDSNLVVTLHTSNGLISPKTIMKDMASKEIGVEHGVVKNVAVINEMTGEAGYLPLEKDEFESPDKMPSAKDEIDKLNRKRWNGEVTNLNISVDRGRSAINDALTILKKGEEGEFAERKEIEHLREMYKLYKDDQDQYSRSLQEVNDKETDARITNLAYGEGFVRDAYERMKDMYTQAKEALEEHKDDDKSKESLRRLTEYRERTVENLKKYQSDPLKVKEFADTVAEGMRLLSTIPQVPQQYKPIEDFAVDKASETFSNVAVNAYKEFGDHAPILSIENPPVGMGLSRADEIVRLIKETRTKVENKLIGEGLSKKDANAQAEKLVGVTWDVGHINMIKKYGFDNDDLAHETEKVKPFLKHVHLSDNFGMEHTELPMGMGNVPMDKHMKVIGEKTKELKHIVETGGHWYNDFRTSPLPETLAAFGSQLYPMQMQPYWDQAQARALTGGYFSGYGMNPEVHHSIYGAGFSGLPSELGGQIGGGRNRLSGTPME